MFNGKWQGFFISRFGGYPNAAGSRHFERIELGTPDDLQQVCGLVLE